MSLLGPSLVHLHLLLQVTVPEVGMALSFRGAGFLLGTFMVFLVIDKLNKEVVMSFCMAMMGASLIMAPLMWNYYIFAGCMCGIGISLGAAVPGRHMYLIFCAFCQTTLIIANVKV